MAAVRVLAYFVMDRVGRIIFGSLLLIAGIVWGMTSHTVTYHQAPQADYQVLYLVPETGPSATSDYYINPVGSHTYYIVKGYDFTPYLDLDPPYVKKMKSITIVYKDETQNVDKPGDSGTKVQGTGYPVVKLTSSDASGQQQVYYTSEYALNPNGYTDDRWLLGKVGIGLGIALIAFSLLAPLVIRLLFGEDDQEVDENKLSPQAKLRALRKMNRSPWGRRSRSGGRSLGDTTK